MKKLFTLLLFLPFLASAQYGVLDNDFDADGIASFEVGNQTYNTGYDVAVQQDGKILVLGETELQQPVGVVSFVIRLFPDGSLDQTFGQGGVLLIQDIYARQMVVQPDGKIVVVGAGMLNNSYSLTFARLSGDNGTYDNSFGVGGSYFINYPIGSLLLDVALQSDGKIVAAGYTSDTDRDVLLIRLTEDGIEDDSFSFDGEVVTDVNDDDEARSLIIGDDGKITVAGVTETEIGMFINRESLLIRYNADGTLDQSFGTNGIEVPNLGEAGLFNDIVFAEPGKIYACGLIDDATDEDFLVAKFHSDGSLDNSFGTGGFTETDFFGNDDEAAELIFQPDGRILVAGKAVNGSQSVGAIIRHNDNGLYDPSFGNVGIVTTPIGAGNEFVGVVLQDDLKILCAGTEIDNQFNSEVTVARYTSGMNVGIGDVDAYIGSTLIYPNPLTDQSITIEYELKESQSISLGLYTTQGKLVANLVPSAQKQTGQHVETHQIPDLPAGQYLLKLGSNDGAVTVQLQVK